MKITHIVWDWNGTLFDDVDLGIRCVNQLLSRYGLEQVDKNRYYQVFGFPISDYYKRLGFDFDKTPYPVLAKEYMDIYVPESQKCSLRENAQQTVDALKELGCKNIILSASKREILLEQINNCGLKNIDHVYGIDNIHASGKVDLAIKMRRDFKNANILFVGDTPHDKDAADAAQAKCVFISGGHIDGKKLAYYGVVLSGLKDVVDYVKRLEKN